MLRHLTFGLLAAFVPSLYAADAGNADEKDLKRVLSDYGADFSMPDTPGLSIVGLSSQNVLRPATPRTLGLAALQGRNDDGTPKQGFAVDVAPTKLLYPTMTKGEYDARLWRRALWNTQASLGVGQPLSDKDKSTRLGLGISSVLWRNATSDPLRDKNHGNCLDDPLHAALPKNPVKITADSTKADKTQPDKTKADKTQNDSPAPSRTLKSCYDDLEERTWNSSAWMVGLAAASVSGRDPTVLPDARPRGYWTSFNYGFEGIEKLQPVLQVTAGYRRLRDEIITDPADKTKFVARDSQLVGAKLYGRSSVANLFIEASRKHSTIDGRATEHANLFVFGAEKKLADNLWLTLAVGTNHGGTTANPTYVSTGLKVGYESTPSIK